jgi:hypothetical protein
MTESILLKIVYDIIKGLIFLIPDVISSYSFKRFFGQNAFKKNKVYLVVDPYEHPTPRSKMTAPTNRFIKDFKGRKQNSQLIGEDKLLGTNVTRVIKYASSTFGKYIKKTNSLNIVLDEDVINNWEGTFICSGSSDSNIKTFDFENLQENNLYKFEFDKSSGSRCFKITGQTFKLEPNGKDIAIISRLRNPHSKGDYIYVCAGLGEWGTSGAIYYLFKYWNKLHKKYKKDNFCLVVQVDVKSDETARVIRELKV